MKISWSMTVGRRQVCVSLRQMDRTMHFRPFMSTLVPRLVTGLSSLVALTGCGGQDLFSELPASVGEVKAGEGVLSASIRISGGASTPFVADEVVASVGPSPRGRELVIYAQSSDLNETLAFVIDLGVATFPGTVDLSQHGVLYVEPGAGLSGGDLTFDGLPSGVLELEGLPTPGASISGRFNVSLPGYDPSRGSDDVSVQLDGTFMTQVVAHPS